MVQESAGKASIYSPEQLDNFLLLNINHDWNADSGATSHMTPHRHWGSILFQPFINGQKTQSLLFSRVLHVPHLQNNLLSILYLTKHKNYNIYIDSKTIHFIQFDRLLFTATITSQNSAFLDGCTVPVSLPLDSANISSTLPAMIMEAAWISSIPTPESSPELSPQQY